MTNLSRNNPEYAPASRLLMVQSILAETGGATVYELAERLGCSVRTAIRYLRATESAGVGLYEATEGRRKLWRLAPSARHELVRMSMQQMVTLFLSRRVFDFLQGTGFKEDLDDVFEKLERILKRKDFVAAKNLDRKLFDANEAAYLYDGRLDDVNELVTALLREEKLDVVYLRGSDGDTLRFVLRPYSLMVFRKGLYVIGVDDTGGPIRTFALDGFKKVRWRRADGFEYPRDYDPASVRGDAFGIIRGEKTRVRIRFDPKMVKYVKRRLWHRTQRFVKQKDGGVEMTMTVEGIDEVKAWVLSFGASVEVLEPLALRAAVHLEAAALMKRHAEAGSE
jgi:proteasome accessory factor B